MTESSQRVEKRRTKLQSKHPFSSQRGIDQVQSLYKNIQQTQFPARN
jgi:hypothetical protein